MRGERIQISQKLAVFGPLAKLHLMALVALESISVKIVIAMGLYKGWRGGGGGGALCPQFFLDPPMHEDYAFVCVC